MVWTLNIIDKIRRQILLLAAASAKLLMYLEPTKFVILRIFWDKIWWFCENLEFGDFVKFEILNPSENRNLRSLTLDHKISIFDQNWTNLMKILTKIENLRSLTLKSKIWRNHKIWNP